MKHELEQSVTQSIRLFERITGIPCVNCGGHRGRRCQPWLSVRRRRGWGRCSIEFQIDMTQSDVPHYWPLILYFQKWGDLDLTVDFKPVIEDSFYNDQNPKGTIMKLRNVFTSVLVAMALFISSACIAQGDHNEFGFYVDQQMSGTHAMASAYSQVEVYMIITYPYNEDLGRPIESISGIEFRSSNPIGTAENIGTYWAIDVIDFGNPEEGHHVGFGAPMLVSDNAVYIGSKNYLLFTDDPFGVYLGPGLVFQSIPGHMAFLEFDGDVIHPLYPTSGSHDAPVFGFNMEVVATEKTTFGDLKALFR